MFIILFFQPLCVYENFQDNKLGGKNYHFHLNMDMY